MRKTIHLDDELGRRMLAAADARGQSLSAFLAEAGRLHLDRPAAAVRPFELITRGGGGPRPGIDLDRTGELLAADDRAAYGTTE